MAKVKRSMFEKKNDLILPAVKFKDMRVFKNINQLFLSSIHRRSTIQTQN